VRLHLYSVTTVRAEFKIRSYLFSTVTAVNSRYRWRGGKRMAAVHAELGALRIFFFASGTMHYLSSFNGA
jgi:hypothetical protein